MVDGEIMEQSTRIGSAAGSGRKPRASSILKHGIPNRLYDLDKHFDILGAYCSIYSSKNEPLSTQDLSAIKDISIDSATRNNSFYVDTGFLNQEKGRRYSPTKGLQEFIRNRKFGRDEEAKRNLRDLIADKWFIPSIKAALDYRSPADEKALLNVLAYDVNSEPEENDASLRVFLELLVYAQILRRTPDDKYDLITNGADEGNNPLDEEVGTETSTDELTEQAPVPSIKQKVGMTAIRLEQSSPKVSIQFNFNISNDTTPEHIKEVTRAIIEAATDGVQ